MIAAAHAIDLLTTPYVFNPDEAARHDPRRGRPDRGAYGRDHGRRDRRTRRQDRWTNASTEIEAIAEAALTLRPDVLVLCHGGPISMPEDARYVLDRAPNCHGFYGASSIERLPVELAIKAQVQAFKSLTTGRREHHDRKPENNFVYPRDVDAFGFDWGQLALTVAPEVNGAAAVFGRRGRSAARAGPQPPQPSRAPRRSSSSSPATASRWSRTQTATR